MKKKLLPLAVAAGLVGAVSAAQAEMHVNHNGLGEVLIYPFYSANGGNDTYVHVVNTTEYTKAVKVRFIEAMNSQEVLDFNLYLSPEDVWAGVITADPNGEGAIIRTVDESCTVPELGQSAGVHVGSKTTLANGKTRRDQRFVNTLYDIEGETERGFDRTVEGYLEIIEMGQLDPTEGLGLAAVHKTDGIPNDCGAIRAAWSSGGAWATDSQEELLGWFEGEDYIGGGLYGFGVVINVDGGTSVGYDATAIANFAWEENFETLHSGSSDLLPSLAQANEWASIFDSNTATASDYEFSSGIDAVSALLMKSSISNDYLVDPAVNGSTDWVVSMPTKSFYVSAEPAAEPFSVAWDGETRSCEPVGMAHWDREELYPTTPVQGPGFSPQPEGAPSDEYVLCTEVSVLHFGEESALKGSDRISYGFTPNYNEGWARMSFLPIDLADPSEFDGLRQIEDLDGNIFNGLPVIGFAVFNYVNGVLGDGILSNYQAGTTHKAQTLISLPQ
ncbi:MAG: hypothetical protein M0P11_07535 [Anaerolineaceae bacterium]|nr:hypothetical protein [Anaerolineaceae bacterium]